MRRFWSWAGEGARWFWRVVIGGVLLGVFGGLGITDWIVEWVDGGLEQYGVDVLAGLVYIVFILSYLGLIVSVSLVVVWMLAKLGEKIRASSPSSQLKVLSRDISEIIYDERSMVMGKLNYVMSKIVDLCLSEEEFKAMRPMEYRDFMKFLREIEGPARRGDTRRVRQAWMWFADKK